MRELKFRAWNKKYHLMRRVDRIFFNEETIEVPNFDEWIEGLWWMIKDCEIMQYTSLKDKNNREIYEEDIILCSDNDQSYKRIISYDIDESCFGFNEFGLTFSKQNEIHFEIIGNIHENPELINKKYEFTQISII